MSTDVDVCASCSDKVADIKSAILCTVCKKFFHGTCEGVSDLRGFHMKRPSWKCSSCAETACTSQLASCIKRYKCDSGNAVEVDRLLVEDLVSKINDLTNLIGELRTDLDSTRDENIKLSVKVDDLTHTVVELKKQLQTKGNDKSTRTSTSLSSGFSYAGVTKTKVNAPSTSVPSTTRNTLFTFGADENKNTDNSPGLNEIFETVISPKSQSSNVVQTNVNNQKTNDDTFIPVTNRRRKRFSRPVIGTLEPSVVAADSNAPVLLQGAERRQWIYLGRVQTGTTIDSINKYVESHFGTTDVKCFKLMQSDDLCSFKIGVRESILPELLQPEKWPKNVAVREFIQFPRRNRDLKSPTADNRTKDFQSSVDKTSNR